MSNNLSELQAMYSASSHSVRISRISPEDAEKFYGEYRDFIRSHIDLNKKVLLDVGCGNGWSTSLVSKYTDHAVGLDLHANEFEPDPSNALQFMTGSAMNLPFENNSFDVVTTHECIEHVPNSRKALEEFDRVLKPGGYVVVVGPNLFSILQSVRGILFYVWRNRPLSAILFRVPSLPRHPHGNTLPEVTFKLFSNLFSIAYSYISRRPLFKKRAPDLRPPFHADSDACYFLNPLDLKFFFEARGYETIKLGRQKFPMLTAMLPSGTWFIAKKKNN